MNDPKRLSSFLGPLPQSVGGRGPDRTPPESERRTGKVFNRRIALITRLRNRT